MYIHRYASLSLSPVGTNAPLYGEEEKKCLRNRTQKNDRALQLQETPNRVFADSKISLSYYTRYMRQNHIGVFQIYRSDRRQVMIVKDKLDAIVFAGRMHLFSLHLNCCRTVS
jgi:hypothetical protein